MPWIEALLRGQKVFARANADGTLASEGGRVEIRYKKTDPRAYRAAAPNLSPVPGASVLDDDACVPGAPVTKDDTKTKKAASRAAPSEPLPEGAWIVYADGACSGNPGPCGLGVVVIRPGGGVFEGFEFLGTGTNNVAELTAVLHALDAIPTDAPAIVIHTDSQYAIGVLQKGWKAKANQALIAKVKAALHLRARVKLVYVPGHAGVPLNERADELAREAVRSASTRPVIVACEP